MILGSRYLSSRSVISRLGYAMPAMNTSSPEPGPYAGWTREQLIERLTTLEAHRPKDAVPILNPKILLTSAPSKLAEKNFEFSRHPRRKIALKFCYSGWEYGGLAFQLGPTPLPTVENVLFDALAKCRLVDPAAGFDGCGWEKCGRTDRGVSAAGQVVSLWIRSALPYDEIEGAKEEGNTLPPEPDSTLSTTRDIQNVDDSEFLNTSEAQSSSTIPKPKPSKPSRPEFDYLVILNRVLPATIRILAWSPVSTSFSARFSCKYRHYKYFFSPSNLSIPLMQAAANRLVGEHDFRNLCKLDPQKQITSFRRNVSRADIEPLQGADGEGMYVFNLVGSAFLYHQVRHIMAILFLVGTGLERPDIVSNLMNVEENLESPTSADTQSFAVVDRKPEYQMADALPLMLWDCGYEQGDVLWRTSGRKEGDNNFAPIFATGGDLHHQLDSIHSRSRIFTVLDRHFLLAASAHHPPSPSIFPLLNGPSDLKPSKQAINIPLGGGTFKRTVTYAPVLQRKRLDTVEVMNERWRLGKGVRKDMRRKEVANEDADE